MFSIAFAFSSLFGQDAARGISGEPLPACYQHLLPGLAMLSVVAAVLAVLVGVRRMMR
ncbi:MAG: hypothetical protein WBW75_13145 [Mycobacterium sp.]|uniref:hypothetical protein n=1 Tax=Mycobacterium sp. TaxID=1785 RepID=UPI003C36CB2B